MFKNLQQLAVADKTAWMDLPLVAPGARIQLKPATTDNDAYLNDLLKRTAQRARTKGRKVDGLSSRDVDEDRAENRLLIAETCLVGWENILDDNNQPVPFSKEMAHAFMQALPPFIVDRISNFASTPENFLRGLPTPDGVDLAGK